MDFKLNTSMYLVSQYAGRCVLRKEIIPLLEYEDVMEAPTYSDLVVKMRKMEQEEGHKFEHIRG